MRSLDAATARRARRQTDRFSGCVALRDLGCEFVATLHAVERERERDNKAKHLDHALDCPSQAPQLAKSSQFVAQRQSRVNGRGELSGQAVLRLQGFQGVFRVVFCYPDTVRMSRPTMRMAGCRSRPGWCTFGSEKRKASRFLLSSPKAPPTPTAISTRSFAPAGRFTSLRPPSNSAASARSSGPSRSKGPQRVHR